MPSIIFFAALISFLAYLSEAGILLWLHIKPTGYSYTKNAVSDYGVGSTKKLFSLYLHCSNLGSVWLAVVLAGESLLYVPLRIMLFLFLLVISRIGLSYFPTDLEGNRPTRTGFMHYIFAILVFGFLYITITTLTPYFGGIPAWHVFHAILSLLSVLTTISLITVIITMWRPLRNVFGIFERLFIITTTVWFIMVSGFFLVMLRL